MKLRFEITLELDINPAWYPEGHTPDQICNDEIAHCDDVCYVAGLLTSVPHTVKVMIANDSEPTKNKPERRRIKLAEASD